MGIIETTMARVLVVEDEPNIGAIIVFKLEREGHTVTWVTEATGVTAAGWRFARTWCCWTQPCQTAMPSSCWSVSSPATWW